MFNDLTTIAPLENQRTHFCLWKYKDKCIKPDTSHKNPFCFKGGSSFHAGGTNGHLQISRIWHWCGWIYIFPNCFQGRIYRPPTESEMEKLFLITEGGCRLVLSDISYWLTKLQSCICVCTLCACAWSLCPGLLVRWTEALNTSPLCRWLIPALTAEATDHCSNLLSPGQCNSGWNWLWWICITHEIWSL